MKPAVFARAIHRTVFPGAIVLDLGGDCALQAVVACRAGAASVLSVQSTASLPVAREVAAINGCAETIRFVDDASVGSLGAQRVDVILATARGALPVYGRSVLGVARRIGALAAVPIPRREHLFVAVVSAPRTYARHVSAWDTGAHGIELAAARQPALNAWALFRDDAAERLVEPARWATIDYTDPRVDARTLQGSVELTARAAGLAHGLAIWSSVDLTHEIVQDHAPAFFPWLEPVALSSGDHIALSLRVDAIGDSEVWSWTSRIESRAGTGKGAKRFEQSTFWSSLLTARRLDKTEATYVPSLGEDGQIIRAALAMMGDRAPIGRIAGALALAFPVRLGSPDAASEAVEHLASTYARVTDGQGQS